MNPILFSLLLCAAPATPAEGETNALSLLSGARQVNASGQPEGNAEALIDGQSDQRWEPTVSGERQAVFELPEAYDLSRGEAINSNVEESWPGISVKRLRLESGPGPVGPWKPLADATLEKKLAPQSFKVAGGKAVRYVRVSLLENYGSTEWFSLSELSLFGRPSESHKVDFNGVWDTSYGEMKLTQTGQRIWGCYGWPDSKTSNYTVDGTLEGRVFAGTWRQVDDVGNEAVGLIVFALNKEGDLSGVWGTDATNRTGRWDGHRKGEAALVCEPPEKSLRKELAAKGRVVLRGILFDTAKDVIRPESEPVLRELAAAMKATPGKAYLIEGHTDDRGGKEFNQALSEKRSASVKTWLEKAGVKAKLKPVGYGLTRPAAPNTTDGGRAANRRVEVAAEE